MLMLFQCIGHKHTVSAQHRLMRTDTESFVTTLVAGPQDCRHLFANV